MTEPLPRIRLWTACLLITGTLGTAAIAGEPAQVSTPSNRKGPAELPNRKKLPSFRSLDGSSMGGVIDGKATESIPQVDPVLPDARKQLELFERLDKKRNFLLSDPSSDRGRQEMRSFDKGSNASDDTLSVGPRKPRTALERRLKNDAEAARNASTRETGTDDNRTRADRGYLDRDRQGDPTDRDEGGKKTNDGDDEVRDNDGNNDRPEESTDLTQSFQKQLDPDKGNALEQRLSKTGASSGVKIGSESDPRPENLRSTPSNLGGRGSLVDDLSRQRIERYQQVTGGGGLLRSSEAPEPSALGRGREMRVDAFGPVGVSPAASRPGSGLGGPGNETPSLDLRAGRSGLSAPPSTFSLPAPSAGSGLLSPPQTSPSQRILRDNRPAPPRFQP